MTDQQYIDREAWAERWDERARELGRAHSATSRGWAQLAWEVAYDPGVDPKNRKFFMEDMHALTIERGIEGCPAPSTLLQYADAYQAWTRPNKNGDGVFEAPPETPFSVLLELRHLPERFDLVKQEPRMTWDRARAYVRKERDDDLRTIEEIEEELRQNRRRRSGKKLATRPNGEPMDQFVKRLDEVIQDWRDKIKAAIADGEVVEDDEILEEARRHVERLATDLAKLEPATV